MERSGKKREPETGAGEGATGGVAADKETPLDALAGTLRDMLAQIDRSHAVGAVTIVGIELRPLIQRSLEIIGELKKNEGGHADNNELLREYGVLQQKVAVKAPQWSKEMEELRVAMENNTHVPTKGTLVVEEGWDRHADQ